MPFIGIVTSKNNEAEFRKLLSSELEKNNIDNNFIFINENNIENMKNIIFDTIIINSNVLLSKNILQYMLKKVNYLIINADEIDILKIINDLQLSVITYGFNQKSTITASSVNEETILFCVQRSLKNKKNIVLEPQEIKIKKFSKDIYISMVIYILLLIYK